MKSNNPYDFLSTLSSHRLRPSQTVQFVCVNFIDYYVIY